MAGKPTQTASFWNFNFPPYNPRAPLPQTATVYFIEAHGQIAGLIGPVWSDTKIMRLR